MITQLECIPCFLRQSLEALRQITDDEKTIKKAMRRVLKEASEFDLNLSPPEMGQIIHKIIREESGHCDPYYEIKKKSDECAMSMYSDVTDKIKASKDPFASAVRFAIAGNILDFALLTSWDEKRISASFEKALHHPLRQENVTELNKEVKEAKTILILGDNAGETVFDKILIESFDTQAGIYYAVKGSPVINDATEEDAKAAGLDKAAKIISNGSDAPGTVLHKCSEEFLKLFYSADLVIAKGQANFETLNDCERKVYFLTQMKCAVIAERYGYEVGQWLITSSDELARTGMKAAI